MAPLSRPVPGNFYLIKLVTLNGEGVLHEVVIANKLLYRTHSPAGRHGANWGLFTTNLNDNELPDGTLFHNPMVPIGNQMAIVTIELSNGYNKEEPTGDVLDYTFELVV
jgi:hypothetical protein